MNRRVQRQKLRNFNLRRVLRARLFRAPAFNHQLLDEWYGVMRRKQCLS